MSYFTPKVMKKHGVKGFQDGRNGVTGRPISANSKKKWVKLTHNVCCIHMLIGLFSRVGKSFFLRWCVDLSLNVGNNMEDKDVLIFIALSV